MTVVDVGGGDSDLLNVVKNSTTSKTLHSSSGQVMHLASRVDPGMPARHACLSVTVSLAGSVTVNSKQHCSRNPEEL
jgi:hypothetical protein